jgi:uncharacterized coiled-coil protein SlyX
MDSARCDCLASVVAHQEDCANPGYVAELEAEVERLREALNRILSRCQLSTPTPADAAAFAYHEAKRALREKP